MTNKELPSWADAFRAFCIDYDKYNGGNPKMPFQELRHSLAILIEELDSALDAAIDKAREPSTPSPAPKE